MLPHFCLSLPTLPTHTWPPATCSASDGCFSPFLVPLCRHALSWSATSRQSPGGSQRPLGRTWTASSTLLLPRASRTAFDAWTHCYYQWRQPSVTRALLWTSCSLGTNCSQRPASASSRPALPWTVTLLSTRRSSTP